MKKLLLIFTFFTLSQSFAQVTVNDLGKISYDELKKKVQETPCLDNGKDELTYCLEDGNIVSYLFENEVLDVTMKKIYFSSQTAAEKKLQQEIARSKSALGINPTIDKEFTLFIMKKKGFTVGYKVKFDEVKQSWAIHELLVKV